MLWNNFPGFLVHLYRLSRAIGANLFLMPRRAPAYSPRAQVGRVPRRAVRPVWLLLGAMLLAASDVSGTGTRVNFAKYQATAASSQFEQYVPDFAVDGLVSNFSSWRTTGTAGSHWLELAFPRPLPFGSAHLYLGLDNSPTLGLTAFRLQIQVGGAWVDVPGGVVTSNTATEVVVLFSEPVVADRVRLSSTNTGQRVVREIALFPPNLVGGTEQGYPIGTDVRLNLAYQRPAVSSSNRPNGFAKLAVDGLIDDTSRWVSQGDVAGDTWEVDLLADHAIGSAHLYSGFANGEMFTDFVVEGWTGSAWQVMDGGSVTGNTSLAREVVFPTPMTTSRVRLRSTTASRCRVRELVLFPPRAGGYPLGQDVVVQAPPTTRWDDFSDSSWRLRSAGPDLRLAALDGQVILGRGNDGVDTIRWQLLLNHRDGSYRLRHPATGLGLALGSISTADQTPVVLEPYTGLPHQDWRLETVAVGEYRLLNAFSGLAIQPANNSWSYGTPLVVATPSDQVVQRWRTVTSEHHPKKGLAATGTQLPSYHERFPSAWSYTWGRQRPSAFAFLPTGHTYNPMQWGNFNWTHGSNQGPIDLLLAELQSNPKPTYVMGFNEPDKDGQADMSPDVAIARWPRLEALNLPLVAPAPASTANGWLASFVSQADARGYRRDYTAVHWYGPPDADGLIAGLQGAYQTFGRPVWLTEFSVVRWSGGATWDYATNYHFLAEFLWRAESLPWLKRYSLFHFVQATVGNPNQGAPDPDEAPRSNSIAADGSITLFGELYAGWDGVAAVVNEKAYHVHNRGWFRRLRQAGTAAAPVTVPLPDASSGQQWFLMPGTTENTVRILSTVDARPLTVVGGVVGLGVAGEQTPAGEWRLVPDQNGWHFLLHPVANSRLRATGHGPLTLVSATSSTDLDRWRFVVPVAPEALGPPPPHPFAAFATWQEAALAGVAPADQGPLADPDRDGHPNLLEFAFLTDPTAPEASPLRLTAANATSLTVEFRWNWRAEGLRWQFRGSQLADRATWPVVDPAAVTTTRDGDVDRLVVTLNPIAPTASFVVLEVIEE